MPGRIVDTNDQSPSPEVPPGVNLVEWALSTAPATPPPPPPPQANSRRSAETQPASAAAPSHATGGASAEIEAARARARARVESIAQTGRQQLADGRLPDDPTSLAMAFLERMRVSVMVAEAPVNSSAATSGRPTPPPPPAPVGDRGSPSELRLPPPALDVTEGREQPRVNGHADDHDDTAEYAAVDRDRVAGGDEDGRSGSANGA